jgi:hypothetical protein
MDKEAQENPAQPSGWAVQPAVNPDAHPGGELEALEQQKRQDTAQWEDAQNRSPMDNINPAQPPGFAVPEPSQGPIPGQGADSNPPMGPVVTARVFVSKTATALPGAKVLLGTGQEDYSIGQVVADVDDKMWVSWRDGEDTVENKGDYELIVRNEE